MEKKIRIIETPIGAMIQFPNGEVGCTLPIESIKFFTSSQAVTLDLRRTIAEFKEDPEKELPQNIFFVEEKKDYTFTFSGEEEIQHSIVRKRS